MIEKFYIPIASQSKHAGHRIGVKNGVKRHYQNANYTNFKSDLRLYIRSVWGHKLPEKMQLIAVKHFVKTLAPDGDNLTGAVLDQLKECRVISADNLNHVAKQYTAYAKTGVLGCIIYAVYKEPQDSLMATICQVIQTLELEILHEKTDRGNL